MKHLFFSNFVVEFSLKIFMVNVEKKNIENNHKEKPMPYP